MGRRVGFPRHTKGTGTHSSECSEVVLSLLLQLDLLLQPVGRKGRLGGSGRSAVPPWCCPPELSLSPVGPSRKKRDCPVFPAGSRGLAGGQGLFLPFPIIVNAREITKT